MDNCLYYNTQILPYGHSYYYISSPIPECMNYVITNNLCVSSLPATKPPAASTEQNPAASTEQDTKESAEEKYLTALTCIDQLLKRVEEETEKNKVLTWKYRNAKEHLKKIKNLSKSNKYLH